MTYLLDSSVFITAYRVHYGLDFCPAFWDWVLQRHCSGAIFSIAAVRDELNAHDDDLARWARRLPPAFFLEPGPGTGPCFSKISQWSVAEQYETAARTVFLQTADYFLVAQALEGGHTVVSYEVPGGSKKRIKIPDACFGVNVKCIQPHDMLRRERARFVLPVASPDI